jgi:hypothetical protein
MTTFFRGIKTSEHAHEIPQTQRHDAHPILWESSSMSMNWHSWYSLQVPKISRFINRQPLTSLLFNSGMSLLPKLIFLADADTDVSNVFQQSTDFQRLMHAVVGDLSLIRVRFCFEYWFPQNFRFSSNQYDVYVIDISYTLDSASQNTKLKPKISTVSPMKIGGGHIGRSHSSMKCYRKHYTFLHLWIKNTFLRYVCLEIAPFLEKGYKKNINWRCCCLRIAFKHRNIRPLECVLGHVTGIQIENKMPL